MDNQGEMFKAGVEAAQRGLSMLLMLHVISLEIPDLSDEDEAEFIAGYKVGVQLFNQKAN